jgi:3-deoxy-D-manno-octulosonic-acid transferase
MTQRIPATLRLYRLAWGFGRPLVPLFLARRLGRGKEVRERLRERKGHAQIERPAGPMVWVHAASVGELTSVFALIERIRSQQVAVLVTTGTATSAALAAQRQPPDVIHQFVPLDHRVYIRRFLDHWQPDLALLVESDLWPNLIIESATRSIPLILINGRLSESSFRRWRRFPRTISALLDRFDLCLARMPADATFLSDLGAPRVVMTGNLKFDVPPPPVSVDKLNQLRSVIGNRPILGAASTHPGEEAMVLAAHHMLRVRVPGLLTVIAPRHPERGAGVAELARSRRLRAALRSRKEMPDASTDIYIADTIGELGLLYRLAPVVFIGGSLIRHGGQNPIEAAKLGAANLHGPNVANFAEIYRALDGVRGAGLVGDPETLADRAYNWLRDPAARDAAAEAAHNTVMALGGALDRTVQALDPYLMQLRLGRRVPHA